MSEFGERGFGARSQPDEAAHDLWLFEPGSFRSCFRELVFAFLVAASPTEAVPSVAIVVAVHALDGPAGDILVFRQVLKRLHGTDIV